MRRHHSWHFPVHPPRSCRALAAPPMSALAASARGALRRLGGGTRGLQWRRFAKASDPTRAIGVVAHHYIRSHAGFDDLEVHRVHDRGGEPRTDRHAEKGRADPLARREPEADVGRTAGGVHLQLVLQALQQVHHLTAGLIDGSDRHDERIDYDITVRDAVVSGAMHDLLRHLEADIGILGDAGLVVGDRHHRGAVLLHERQHRFEPLLFAGDRVDERLALVDGKSRLERFHNRGVDRERHIGYRLHELHRLGENRRLIRQGDAGVDIQHVGTGRHLRQRIGLDAAEVPGSHLGREDLAPRGVDALADHHEGALEAEHDLAGCGADHGIGHEAILLVFAWGSRPGYHGLRPFSTPERSMISATVCSWRYAMTCTPCTPLMVRISWMRSMQSWRPSAAGSAAPASRLMTASGMCTPGTWVRIHSPALAERSGPTPTRMKTLSSSPSSSTCPMNVRSIGTS